MTPTAGAAGVSISISRGEPLACNNGRPRHRGCRRCGWFRPTVPIGPRDGAGFPKALPLPTGVRGTGSATPTGRLATDVRRRGHLMKLSLVVKAAGKMEGHVLPITLSQFVVGRDPQCHLRPASPMISKRHCAVLQRDGKAYIRDFGSTNGTFLNDQPVKDEVELHDKRPLEDRPAAVRGSPGREAAPVEGPPPTADQGRRRQASDRRAATKTPRRRRRPPRPRRAAKKEANLGRPPRQEAAAADGARRRHRRHAAVAPGRRRPPPPG